MIIQIIEQRDRYESALRAILARRNGVFDDPHLMKVGPLHHNKLDDIAHIAEVALGQNLVAHSDRVAAGMTP